MPARYVFKPSAERDLASLPERVREQFAALLPEILAHPTKPSAVLNTKQMWGTRTLWRFYIGKYRGIYQWDGDVVRFVMFDHRSKVYNRLSELGL